MKIEKINENQIRCTLTKQDLAERQIKISELAYGTEKVKALFREMMQQAEYELGFEAEDIPLMIEAIPLSADTIILVVTKVEYPEELDTRFSKFSEPDSEYLEEDSLLQEGADTPPEGADDIIHLFQKVMEESKKLIEKQKQEQFVPLKELHTKENECEKEEEQVEIVVEITKMYLFPNLEQVAKAARILNGFYAGGNDLYKDETAHKYYLVVRKNSESPETFNKVCNILSEYAMQQKYTPGTEAFLREHHHVILEKNALQVLAEL